jgi:hypothetical protein
MKLISAFVIIILYAAGIVQLLTGQIQLGFILVIVAKVTSIEMHVIELRELFALLSLEAINDEQSDDAQS